LLLLLTKLQRGTPAVQVRDMDGEGEADAKDEAIVPTDLNIITDDDLREIFGKLPANVRLTFVTDCCHSGSMLDQPVQQISGDKDPSKRVAENATEEELAGAFRGVNVRAAAAAAAAAATRAHKLACMYARMHVFFFRARGKALYALLCAHCFGCARPVCCSGVVRGTSSLRTAATWNLCFKCCAVKSVGVLGHLPLGLARSKRSGMEWRTLNPPWLPRPPMTGAHS
jgi:hypothetical protein